MTLNTHVPLATNTAAGGETSITFSSISAGYTDLVLLCSVTCSSTQTLYVRFNGDSAGNYSSTYVYGTGSGAASGRFSNDSKILLGSVNVGMSSTNFSVINASIQNYSGTATKKTILSRQSLASAEVNMSTGTWHNTSAINSLTIIPSAGSFGAGSTFSLYGVKAWAPESTPKATGGYVTSDSTYWYHSFPFSGTFTPNQSLTCDYLVVAGGGGGGSVANIANGGRGGGGAGGLFAGSVALTATNYTVTIGAGGAGGAGGTESDGVSGTNSQFAALTATGGGFGSKANTNAGNGGSGGGAGAWDTATLAGTGTAGQGNDGGIGTGGTGSQTYSGGGGGGFGGAGTAAGSSTVGGNGGLGYSSSISGSSQFYAGGGGGGNYQDIRIPTGGSGVGGNGKSFYVSTPPGNGATSTGSGGGGGCGGHAGAFYGGHGGSGVVIVRYVKA